MKSFCAIVCLLALALASVDARPKRSVYYSPVVASPAVAVASVPAVVQTSQVVHHNPTTVVKTEQVRSGDHASYSYSQEVRAQPVVHTHTHAVAGAPVVAAAAPAAVVSHAHYAYPTAGYGYGYYGYPYASYSSYAHPYGYVVGK